MSLIQAIKTQIRSLIDRANEKTGKTDADLTSAVNSLIESGGSGGWDEIVKDDVMSIGTGLALELSEELFSKYPHMDVENKYFVYFPNATIVKENAFLNARVSSLNLPKVTVIEAHAFHGCDGLYDATLQSVTDIGEYAFQNCYHLKNIYMPNVINIGAFSFDDCEELTSLVLPKCETIGECAFRYTKVLETVDLPNVKTIGEVAFAHPDATVYYTNFKTLLLRSKEMCNMHISAIVGTEIIDNTGAPTGEGFVYVPTSLYESYIADFTPKIVEFATANGVPMDEPTATYIATAILRKLEDYTVDGTTTGELDETKI